MYIPYKSPTSLSLRLYKEYDWGNHTGVLVNRAGFGFKIKRGGAQFSLLAMCTVGKLLIPY